MKPIVNQDRCVGCELCVDICPDFFEMTNEERAVARTILVPSEFEELCKEAEDECPVEAIILK